MVFLTSIGGLYMLLYEVSFLSCSAVFFLNSNFNAPFSIFSLPFPVSVNAFSVHAMLKSRSRGYPAASPSNIIMGFSHGFVDSHQVANSIRLISERNLHLETSNIMPRQSEGMK